MKNLIRALRCSAQPRNTEMCAECKYNLIEEVRPDIPIPADMEIDGVAYWQSCNCDQMVLDAADALERLTEDDLK